MYGISSNARFGTGPEVLESDAPAEDGTVVQDSNYVRWTRKGEHWYPSVVRLERRSWVDLNKHFGPVGLYEAPTYDERG